jgi:hypothetical protein
MMPSTGEMKFDAVSDEDVPVGPTTGCEKIDFVFVIDSSGSMEDNQVNLVNSFPGLVEALETDVAASNWNLMVIDTDAQWSGSDCANACQTLGSCPDEPDFSCDTDPPQLCDITLGAGIVAPYGEAASNAVCDLQGEQRYIRSSHSDLESAFDCVASVGVDGADAERPIDALLRALTPEMNAEDGCNAGFLRDDAILVVTIITDEPDENTEGDAMAWADAVVEAKAGNPDAVVVLGLLPDGDLGMPLCGVEAVPAPRLAAFLDEFDASSRGSVCEADYAPFFVDAVSVISETCDDFIPPG